ncbi:MAG: PadR family transcriptional regulator [Pseudomonadota bacterium]
MDAKTLCLGVLSRGQASGYEIRKEFEEGPFSHFQDVGYGSIYPALKRLVDDGQAEFAEQDQDDRPDKKVYRITARGRQSLFDQVNKIPGPDKFRSDFLFVLMFVELMEPAYLDQVLAERIAFHNSALEHIGKGVSKPSLSPGEKFVKEFGTEWHRMAAEFLDAKRHELIGSLLRDGLDRNAAE